METTFEVFVQLFPTFLLILLLFALFFVYQKTIKYLQLKTKYYTEKLKEIESRKRE